MVFLFYFMSKIVQDPFKLFGEKLRKTLECRQSGQYQEGGKWFSLATEEGDPEALYATALFVRHGGMKMPCIPGVSEKFFEFARSAKSECARIEDLVCGDAELRRRGSLSADSAPLSLDILTDHIKDGFIFLITFVDLSYYQEKALPLMLEAAEWGDGVACLRLGQYYKDQRDLKKAILYFEKGARQKTEDCERLLSLCFTEPGADKFKVITYMLPEVDSLRLVTLLQEDDEYELPILYQFGKVYSRHMFSEDDPAPAHYDEALDIYEQSFEQTQAAVFETILCLKRLGFYKDVSVLIGKYIWAQRFFWLEE